MEVKIIPRIIEFNTIRPLNKLVGLIPTINSMPPNHPDFRCTLKKSMKAAQNLRDQLAKKRKKITCRTVWTQRRRKHKKSES